MVKYAEDKNNKNVALFQSIITNWNNDNIFPRIIAYFQPIFNYKNSKLANKYGYITSWGHNSLYRTETILELHGFNEDFKAEDLAMGLNISTCLAG
jgi:hypothetical protein